jgi:NAD(P)-dependent dehydrogenase (short-subunit alcohol dehydrogenase family)
MPGHTTPSDDGVKELRRGLRARSGAATRPRMGTIVVTGSASGIGATVRRRLESTGAVVIGVDLRGAEIAADLGTPPGRATAIAAVLSQVGNRLDGVVACAGLGPHVSDTAAIVSVNYFGAIALLDGLRGALAAARGAAVAVSSNSATIANSDNEIAAACQEGDEALARRLAADPAGQSAYGGSKLALARWVRRHAPTPAWVGAGVRLNAVAPGAVLTPLLQGGLDHPVLGDAIRNFPIPTGGFGTPDQIAAVITFLLGPDASFCCGSVLFADGGTDALFRPDQL